jgi:hypothetical protein
MPSIIAWLLLNTAGLPEWVWAALLMALFAGMSVLTVVAMRGPLRNPPPPFDPQDDEPGSGAKS